MLTKKDISTLVDALKQMFLTKNDVQEMFEQLFDKKLKLFPTKDEYFFRMDKLSGELKAFRETQELHANEHGRTNDRLERIKQHLHLPSPL